MKTSTQMNTGHKYEIAEWSDYGFWIIDTAKTEAEAKAKVDKLNSNGSAFLQAGYRKKDESL